MKPHPLPPTPRLPSRRASAILATGMLIAGIALGALLGPGPATSLASSTRAAVVARLLALMALDGAGQSDQPLVSSVSAHHATSTHPSTQPSGSTSNSASPGSRSGASSHRAAQSETGSAPSAASTPSAPTHHTASSNHRVPARLPTVGHAWLIVLPYGESFAKVLAEPAAFPYLSAELSQGTLLNGYSALAAQQLEGAATLLSGAVESAVDTIEPPGEPAGAQAADAFLQTVVGEIAATAAYSEGGLIAIAFAGTPTPPATPAPAQTPASPGGDTQTAPSQGQAIPYPAGTQASALSATTTGALLLSPYLRRPGARLTSAFDAAAPRASIEELLSTSKRVGR